MNMSEGKWTPGPWSVKHTPSRVLTGEDARIAEAQECDPWAYAVARIPETGFEKFYDDREPNTVLADAAMHAAAPELYQALDGLVRAYRATLDAGFQRITDLGGACDPVAKMWASDPAVQVAVAALSKASGGSDV